jgi:alkylated DNA repair dioxygenase AlkB
MMEQYKNPLYQVDIVVYKKYLDDGAADSLLDSILTGRSETKHTKHPLTTKAGQLLRLPSTEFSRSPAPCFAVAPARSKPSKKRNKTIYGDIREYVITYRGKTIKTPVLPWTEVFAQVRDKIAETTGQNYNTGVIQIYNSGQVGIKPHKDKEMNAGSKISSISLGQSRVMQFERHGFEPIDIVLDKGDMCIINYPTNIFWLHSIPTDDSAQVRASLIFRQFG